MRHARLLAGAGGLCALFVAPGISAPSEGAPQFTRIAGQVSVPAELADHTMYVDVTINGRGPFRMIVDTGCSLTLISPEVAEAVGATGIDSDEEFINATNGLGDAADVEPVLLTGIELGGVRFEGVEAAVTDTFGRISAIAGKHIDGALGYTLFADLFLGLDVPNRRLLLSSAWPAGVPQVRATLPVANHSDVPFVQIGLQGKSFEAMIDTGANQALHLPPEAAAALQWKIAPRAGPLVAVIDEIGREQIGRLAGRLSLGDVKVSEPIAMVAPGEAALGLRALERYCVVFHPAENKLWLCSADDAAPRVPPERSNGLSLYSEAGGWRIAGIIPGSPAEAARLSTGTLITQIERRPATTWTRDSLQQWIDTHDTMALVVTEPTGERALTLPIWTIVP